MLKVLNRLTKQKDFDNVYENGRSSFDKILGMKTAANGLEHNRFAVVVGAKVSKQAVKRNLIKRRIRGAVRSRLKNLQPGNDCILIALPLIIGKEYSEIERTLDKHFARLRLYKKA